MSHFKLEAALALARLLGRQVQAQRSACFMAFSFPSHHLPAKQIGDGVFQTFPRAVQALGYKPLFSRGSASGCPCTLEMPLSATSKKNGVNVRTSVYREASSKYVVGSP